MDAKLGIIIAKMTLAAKHRKSDATLSAVDALVKAWGFEASDRQKALVKIVSDCASAVFTQDIPVTDERVLKVVSALSTSKSESEVIAAVCAGFGLEQNSIVEMLTIAKEMI